MTDALLSSDIIQLATRVVEENREAGRTIALAESCTGGLVSAAITEIPGSSSVLDRGFVTYSNAAKHEAVGVDMALIETHGAVSEAVAVAMAEGARRVGATEIGLGVTGGAGISVCWGDGAALQCCVSDSYESD